MFGFMGDYPQAEKDALLSKPGLAISQAFLKNISLWIYNLDAIPYSVEDNNTLIRFAKVFEQTIPVPSSKHSLPISRMESVYHL